MPSRKFLPGYDDQAVKAILVKHLVEEGLTVERVAALYGVSDTTVCVWAGKLQVSKPPNRKEISVEELTALAGQGLSRRAISQQLGVGLTTVQRKLFQHNLRTQAERGPKPGTVRIKNCVQCSTALSRSARQYCSRACQKAHIYQQYITAWKEGKVTGGRSDGRVSEHVRRYLIEQRGEGCEICGWKERHPVTGKVPLQAHHINGLSDHRENNLQLLCPNHHSLTVNYGSLNQGKGRKQNRRVS